jgi:coenzyme F420 hydrogenase subunit beta
MTLDHDASAAGAAAEAAAAVAADEGATPALWTPPVGAAAPRELCTDCGISRSSKPGRCGRACQFINPDYESLEARVHGRARDPERPDELHFGPFQRMVRAALTPKRADAQWTGIATRIGERLLETGTVDAVLTMTHAADDRWAPQPAIVTRPEGMAQCRGMKMGYAPLLALLEPALQAGYRRVAVIGIPCQVYALRALEQELGFERIYVIGTPCSDNTTTEKFHEFLGHLTDAPGEVTYFEFRADYFCEMRFTDGSVREFPFLMLPISKLPNDFWPITCRTCVDYTNVLADITVGYMAGEGEQWLLVRNDRGQELVDLLGREVAFGSPGDKGKRGKHVEAFKLNTEKAAGGMPVRGMPNWLRPLVGRIMPKVGPRGLEFARARLEMKAVETIIHLRLYERPRIKHMVPRHVWELARPYGLEPAEDERPRRKAR